MKVICADASSCYYCADSSHWTSFTVWNAKSLVMRSILRVLDYSFSDLFLFLFHMLVFGLHLLNLPLVAHIVDARCL